MKGLTLKLGIKRFQLLVSLLAGVLSFTVLWRGIILPPQNTLVAFFASIGVAVTVYYTQLLVYGVTIPVYLLLKLASKLDKKQSNSPEDGYSVRYYAIDSDDDLVSWDMGNTGESYAVIHSVKTLAAQVSGKPPYTALLVVSPDTSVIYTENDELLDEYISETTIETEEDKFSRDHLMEDGSVKPGIRIVRETRDGRDALLVVMDNKTFEKLSSLILKSGDTIIVDNMESLETLYILLREIIKTYSEGEAGKALIAYSTVKLLGRLEEKGLIDIEPRLKKRLPLEDKNTMLLVNKQIQEEEKLKTNKRSR